MYSSCTLHYTTIVDLNRESAAYPSRRRIPKAVSSKELDDCDRHLVLILAASCLTGACSTQGLLPTRSLAGTYHCEDDSMIYDKTTHREAEFKLYTLTFDVLDVDLEAPCPSSKLLFNKPSLGSTKSEWTELDFAGGVTGLWTRCRTCISRVHYTMHLAPCRGIGGVTLMQLMRNLRGLVNGQEDAADGRSSVAVEGSRRLKRLHAEYGRDVGGCRGQPSSREASVWREGRSSLRVVVVLSQSTKGKIGIRKGVGRGSNVGVWREIVERQ
ncbi:uncharacterized protein EV420DRAFT_1478543 [Desarmillaria tabescens]|uniref:Uncharacterized protein n=1 Tax=Armillaria tabescens TaxID=1929756 RepID=A0AA39KIR3_ARMTA|nr:uncharacterized protein EV420DRAFT_1478543 [Desarmillaria tabescens]KAK0460003.1 hypothetical protein EV420DRAFT_1478543 [Desarmillaria tabescens]